MDLMNLGHGFDSYEQGALRLSCEGGVYLVAVDRDALIPPDELRHLYHLLSANGRRVHDVVAILTSSGPLRSSFVHLRSRRVSQGFERAAASDAEGVLRFWSKGQEFHFGRAIVVGKFIMYKFQLRTAVGVYFDVTMGSPRPE